MEQSTQPLNNIYLARAKTVIASLFFFLSPRQDECVRTKNGTRYTRVKQCTVEPLGTDTSLIRTVLRTVSNVPTKFSNIFFKKKPLYPPLLPFLGEQGWCSGESTHFSPMWPGFKSRGRRHMWVEFLVACSRRSDSRGRKIHDEKKKRGQTRGGKGKGTLSLYNLTRSPLTAALYYLNAWNRLSLLLVLSLAPRGFFSG